MKGERVAEFRGRKTSNKNRKQSVRNGSDVLYTGEENKWTGSERERERTGEYSRGRS